MKIMSKVKIIRKNSIKNVLNEKKLLSKLNNPFIVNMKFSFQDSDNLYLVMDLLLGGDLRYHLNKGIKFIENELRFMLSCTIQGLNYLHCNNILHKDIKPENLVFDSRGYLHITDLGISKIYHEDNGKENSGTPGYMAPEVLFNKNHTFSVDFFAIGVIGYEIIKGKRPYNGKDKKELRKDVISRQAKIKEPNIPVGWSQEAVNFINGLLQRKVECRLGNKDINELINHPWFNDFDWKNLLKQNLEPPFRPPFEGNYNHNLEEEEKIGKATELCYEEIKNKEEYSKYFEDYTFNEIYLNTNTNINNKKNKIRSNQLESDSIGPLKVKYEITSKMINKLKEEIDKISYTNNNIDFKNKNKKNLILNHKNRMNIKNIEKGSQNIKNLQNSFLSFGKSYLFHNFKKEEKDIILKPKLIINKDSHNPKVNLNLNSTTLLNNFSPNYNSNKKKSKFKLLNRNKRIFNDSNLNDQHYFRSIYDDRSHSINPKLNYNKNNNLGVTSNFTNYDKNNLSQNKLPIIKQLMKSSSVENYDKNKYVKKSKIRIDKGVKQVPSNLINITSKYFYKK